MYKKFEINQTKIKGGCQSGRKVVTHHSKSDLPLVYSAILHLYMLCSRESSLCFRKNGMGASGLVKVSYVHSFRIANLVGGPSSYSLSQHNARIEP